MGAKPLFCPPNNQTRILKFCLFKKINMKESRNRDNNTKKTEYILNERCKFCKKKLSMTKKRSSEIFERIEGNFFKIFCLKINFPKMFAPPIFVTQIFAPPIFMTSLCRCVLGTDIYRYPMVSNFSASKESLELGSRGPIFLTKVYDVQCPLEVPTC